jgi:hypothetical protein
VDEAESLWDTGETEISEESEILLRDFLWTVYVFAKDKQDKLNIQAVNK